MKFVEIQPNKDESYEVAYDDKCIVIKQGEDMVWISKAMANWISLNFANELKSEIKLIK